MSNVTVFQSQELGCTLNAIMFNDEPAFEAVKVAEILGYANPHDAISQHCEDTMNLSSREKRELGLPDSFGNRQGVILIPESDLYNLILSSKLESAKVFKRWVTKEILPAIRKSGSYSVIQPKQLGCREATSFNLIPSAIAAAQAFGLEGNQAKLSADKAVKTITGCSVLALLEINLLAEDNEKILTPTEIGKALGFSAQVINVMLSENGYQIKHTSTGGKSEWKLTEKGKEFGIYLDTGKAHSNGTPIQQIKWKESVVAKIKPHP